MTALPRNITYTGTTQAIAQNVPGYTLNSSANPVAPGDYLVLYLTGQGATDPPVATGAPAPAPGNPLVRAVAAVEVRIGGAKADIAFAGLTPGFVGLMQVNLLVPALPSGNHPVALTIGGAAAHPGAGLRERTIY